jgi:hypothetical protein
MRDYHKHIYSEIRVGMLLRKLQILRSRASQSGDSEAAEQAERLAKAVEDAMALADLRGENAG